MGAERGVAGLRLAGAALVAGCAVWMAATEPGPLGWFFVVLLGLFAVGWLFAARGGRRRARGSDAWFLEIGPGGLVLAEGARRREVAWDEVTGVEVDEDRLVVTLDTTTGSPVIVQPRYRGVGLHELGGLLREAHRGATARNGG